MHKKAKKEKGFQREACWGILVIARCSDMAQKCHVKNLSQARKMKYQTVWEETEEYSQMLSLSWHVPSKINSDVSI